MGLNCRYQVSEDEGIFVISVDGVKKHFSSIFHKLGASSRSEAVAIGIRKHLLKA